mgnify:CR=1 FL=1
MARAALPVGPSTARSARARSAPDRRISANEITAEPRCESEAVSMEQSIISLKEQKEGLLLDVTEAEKQLMLLD